MNWDLLATLFVNPIEMGRNHIFLVAPVLAVVALVYKTIRVKHLRDLPLQVVSVWATMLVGLAVLCAALYFLIEYVAPAGT